MASEPTHEALSALIDNELAPAERRQLEEHLAGCEDCRRRLELLRATARAVQELPVVQPPRDFGVPRLRQRAPRLVQSPWLGISAAAAAVLALALIGGIHLLPTPRPASNAAGSTAKGRPTQGFLAPESRGQAASGLGLPAVGTQSATVREPGRPATWLKVATSGTSFAPGATVTADVSISGLGSSPRVQVVLLKGSYGTRLLPTASASGRSWSASYRLGSQSWSRSPGAYQVVVTVASADGSQALVAKLAITES